MSGNNCRNSSIEALRLVGMFLILCCHVFEGYMLPIEAFPLNGVSYLMAKMGGTGDVIFFGITAYYLASRVGEPPSIRASLRRVWIMDRQLLFYSISLFAFTLVVWLFGFGFNSYDGTMIMELGEWSISPLMSRLWWYPSAYALFIVLSSPLDRILCGLGRVVHGRIAVVAFVLYSAMSLSPETTLGWSILLFVYLYVLISYIVRYFNYDRAAWSFIFKMGVFAAFVEVALYSLSNSTVWGTFLNKPQAFTPLAIGLPLIMIAAHAHTDRVIPIVNWAASCTFAMYLILCYPTVLLIVRKITSLACEAGLSYPVILLVHLCVVVLLMLTGLVFDTLRQVIFAISVDRKKGALFDLVADTIDRKTSALWRLPGEVASDDNVGN